MAGRLVLIGTVHRAVEGEASLSRLLEQLRPDLLTLEMSNAALHFRQSRGPELNARLDALLDRLAAAGNGARAVLAEHPQVQGIRRLLALPYEYLAARAWAERAKIPLELVDLDAVSRRKLRRVEQELIRYRNLQTLVQLDEPPEAGSEGYPLARALLFGAHLPQVLGDFLARRRGDEGVGRRDAAMAATLRRLRDARPEDCLVHIGGWVHLLADPQGETLYSRLRDLEPERLLAD